MKIDFNVLVAIRSSLSVVTSLHIFSVQKVIPKDINLLVASECQLKTAGYQSLCKNPQLIIEKSKFVIIFPPFYYYTIH